MDAKKVLGKIEKLIDTLNYKTACITITTNTKTITLEKDKKNKTGFC